MKLAGKDVTFHTALPWPTRRQLRFLRKGNSVQLLETALIVEGNLQRFSMPVIDRFFRRALSEWTTITIPYSRILKYRYTSRSVLGFLVALVFWAPFVLGLVGYFAEGGRGQVSMVVSFALLGMLGSFLVYVAVKSRNYLVFRQADGKRALLVFHVRSKARQKAFREQLTANQAASQQRVGGAKETIGPSRRTKV